MKKELSYYKISPSVVPSDKTSKIEIYGLDERYKFKNGVKYTVSLLPMSYPASPFPETYFITDIKRSCDILEITARDGKLSFEYFFANEQKWNIKISAENPEDDSEDRSGFELRMYSLHEDLMSLRPYKGDLHLHTNRSDGIESPPQTAANYRKAGYDFISITDHHIWGGAHIANAALEGLKTNFAVYEGEEVHSNHMGHLHIVNFDPKSSVNDRILNDRENVLREVEEIRQSEETEGASDRLDLAWRIWTYSAIKKSGGLAILPHVFWFIFGADHVSPEMIGYSFEHRLFDAFEIYGGVNHRENNLQALLFHEMKAKGLSYPVVASTDAHSSREHGDLDFARAYTIAFARDVYSVREAIENALTVGVQADPEQAPNITGELRLARYADFLIEYYFPLHDELAFSSGLMMAKFITGDTQGAKLACEVAEDYIKKHEDEFFAKI